MCRMFRGRRAGMATWLILGMTFAIGGCGESAKPWEVLVPASGTVTFRGKPVQGAQVTLYPTNPDFPSVVRPSAISGDGGEFSIGTFGTDDGLPAGEYRVAVVWHPLVDKGGGASRGDNALPQKYAHPETSNLKVVVGETETRLPTLQL